MRQATAILFLCLAFGCHTEPKGRVKSGDEGDLVGSKTAVAPSVPARRRQQKYLDPFCCVFRQRASHAERFVVGMGEHGHQPPCRHVWFCVEDRIGPLAPRPFLTLQRPDY